MPISDLPHVCADRDTTLIERFRRARRDQTLAVLEGFHAIKHAIRFHAALEQVCAVDPDELRSLVERLAPDIGPELSRLAKAVPRAVFAELAPVPPETGIIAIARRRQADGAAVLAERGTAPVVLLEAPARLGNLGAVVRVATAAGAAAVLTTGPQDPWHPAALRGSAGLHFALPVARIDELPSGRDRPLVAVHPDGEPLRSRVLPERAILGIRLGAARPQFRDARGSGPADRHSHAPGRVQSQPGERGRGDPLHLAPQHRREAHLKVRSRCGRRQWATPDRSPLASGSGRAISVLAKQSEAAADIGR